MSAKLYEMKDFELKSLHLVLGGKQSPTTWTNGEDHWTTDYIRDWYSTRESGDISSNDPSDRSLFPINQTDGPPLDEALVFCILY
ncbi:MAG: hypothetical protein JSS64_02875 [Bacteroidetes bacterium]|nr:hypothetical protein [Bacteroidota bacterium]